MDEDKTLYYLDELSDYKVADEYCDVRDWEVKDADNRTIGKVDGLLVNKNEKRVVYLDVAVDEGIIEERHKPYAAPAGEGVHEFLDKEGDDHIIIPVGLVTLDEENKKVLTSHINNQTFAKTTPFRKGTLINREYEIIALSNYIPDGKFASGEDFYNRREFENTLKQKR